MKRFQKMSRSMFYLVLFVVASIVSLAAARYYGTMTVRDALLLAFASTAGSATTAELMVFQFRRR
ncbi:MAG TPA: hypothetical protein VFS02_21835 [Telluria sp.]|nr:hypothetical protein [Telluria sp.]